MNDKTTLRNNLFNKYFELEEGIPLKDLMIKINPIIETWISLHNLCEKNIENFDSYSSLEMFKLIKNNQYLIMKLMMWEYLIIDLKTKKVLTSNEVLSLFNEEIFINNFKEEKVNLKKSYIDYYYFVKYDGNIQELIDFYFENKKVFDLSSNQIYYKIKIEDAWTYLHIDLTSGNILLGFQAKNQYLYEQLFINKDLTPSNMQDAISKIGIERMNEMFNRIKDVKIPITCLKEDLINLLNIEKLNDKGYSYIKK